MSRVTIVTALFVLNIVGEIVHVASVTCRDMNGLDVDWYYIYKLPKITSNQNPLISEGIGFYYLDYNEQSFQLSTAAMNESSQPVAQTLQEIYNGPSENVAHIMYNDHPPDEEYQWSYGHTKGVVAYDRNNGFWMIHSVPRFPRRFGPYAWADNGRRYGQSVLCVSFKSPEMENIAKQLLYNYPCVYGSNLPSNLLEIAPTFQEVVSGSHVPGAPFYKQVTLRSRGGQQFTHYAKHNHFGKDLYAKLVAEDLERDLYVETWKRNTPLPSDCSAQHHAYNILEIKFPSTDQFSYREDHSKWAISDQSANVICIGDINRERDQFDRGGGTLCANLPNVWQEYKDLIAKYEPCP